MAQIGIDALATLQASQGRGRRPAWPVDVARASYHELMMIETQCDMPH